MNDRLRPCPTVPRPRAGTPGQAPPPSGTARGTVAGHVDLKALAHKVLQAGQSAGQERDSAPKTLSEVCPTVRDTGTANGTAGTLGREALTVQRQRLLLAALREGIPRDVIDVLTDDDLEGCQYWSDTALRTAARWHRDDPCALWRQSITPPTTKRPTS